jgi:glycerophosphoryl diester phosphodiesterase
MAVPPAKRAWVREVADLVVSHSKSSGNPAPVLPPVIGHRGAAAHAPENTLASLRMAKQLGCAWVEFDVRLTADGALVLCHDPRLDRTTSGAGEISAATLRTVRRCDAGSRFSAAFRGERIPTLDEALSLAAVLGLGADIEVKADRGRDYATAAAVSDTLRRLRGGLPPLLVSSFQPWILDALRVLEPEIPRAILFRKMPRRWTEIALRLECAAIGADHRRLTRRRVAVIRAAGWPLAAYTVNDPARARLLFDWGVTSVFTDAPDIISPGSAGAVPASRFAAAPKGRAVARQGAIG